MLGGGRGEEGAAFLHMGERGWRADRWDGGNGPDHMVTLGQIAVLAAKVLKRSGVSGWAEWVGGRKATQESGVSVMVVSYIWAVCWHHNTADTRPPSEHALLLLSQAGTLENSGALWREVSRERRRRAGSAGAALKQGRCARRSPRPSLSLPFSFARCGTYCSRTPRTRS